MRKINGTFRKIIIFVLINTIIYSLIGANVRKTGLLENYNNSYNILIVNSYNEENAWEKQIVDSIKEEVKNNKNINVKIAVEYLDYKNVTNNEYYYKFNELLKSKYKSNSIDAIIALDDEAFYYIKSQIDDEENMLYDIPLIYAGVNFKGNINDNEKDKIIGINSKSNILKLINMIENLDSDVKNIDVIFEDSVYCNQMRKDIEAALNVGWNDVGVNFIQSSYIEEVIEKLESLEKNGDVLIIAGDFKYKSNNKYISPTETIEILKFNINAPMYSVDLSYLNEDITGGIYNDGKEIGRNLTEILIRVLEKQNFDFSEYNLEAGHNIYFDYTKVYESNIDVLKIPKDAILLNKPFYGILLPTTMRLILSLVIIGLSIAFIVLIYYGVDKRSQLNIEKNEKERAKDRERLQNDFIVNMSHELRTPLNIVINSTKLIELKVRNNDYNEEYLLKRLHNINQNSNRLLKLINNVIDITKVESGFLSLKLKNHNIVEIVESVFEEVIDYAKKKKIEVIFDTSHEEIITAIDKEKIERIILNLLSNSIKYTQEGGCIHGKVSKLFNMIQIEVKDNGFGIPEDKLKDIFHRFYQVESPLSRSNEGSGIGLCIVKELVNLHKGNIIVNSKVGQGTSFIIEIPIVLIDKSEEVEDKMITNLTDIVNREMSDVNK